MAAVSVHRVTLASGVVLFFPVVSGSLPITRADGTPMVLLLETA